MGAEGRLYESRVDSLDAWSYSSKAARMTTPRILNRVKARCRCTRDPDHGDRPWPPELSSDERPGPNYPLIPHTVTYVSDETYRITCERCGQSYDVPARIGAMFPAWRGYSRAHKWPTCEGCGFKIPPTGRPFVKRTPQRYCLGCHYDAMTGAQIGSSRSREVRRS